MRMWDSVKAAASGVEDDGSYESPEGPEDCEARRAAAFRVTAADLALPGDWGARPFGIVVEVGGARGVMTLVAFATGESSMFTGSGSGMIGRPSHVHVVVQAKRLVKEAAGYVPLLEPAAALPHPPAKPPTGAMRFHVLTDLGVFTAEAAIGVLRGGEHPLSPLLDIADELMLEFLQYLDIESGPVPPPTAGELVKALAMVAVIAALTVAAWFIPAAWLRWPAVAIGAFFTIAALIVPYAMLTAPRLTADRAPSG